MPGTHPGTHPQSHTIATRLHVVMRIRDDDGGIGRGAADIDRIDQRAFVTHCTHGMPCIAHFP